MALKVGIIGCGGIANFHMMGYKALGERVEIVACADINEERLNSYADKHGIENRYNSAEAMLAAHKLDMVSVCTWNNAHAPCTIAALNAGCHVLCEKPMALNTAEALQMKEAALKNDKILMIGFVRRQGNDAADAIDLIKKGQLGEVYYAKASYLRRCGFPGGWFGDKRLSGGGPLIDLGVHVIDLTRYIMGCPKPVSVFGATFNKIGARSHIKTTEWESETSAEEPIFTVEDLASAMIRFDNGAVLHVEASFNLNLKENTENLEIYGNKAGLCLKPFELHTELGSSIADITIQGDHTFMFEREFCREIKNFADAVEGKRAPLANYDDGIELMKILDAIYLSAETGKSVDIQ